MYQRGKFGKADGGEQRDAAQPDLFDAQGRNIEHTEQKRADGVKNSGVFPGIEREQVEKRQLPVNLSKSGKHSASCSLKP